MKYLKIILLSIFFVNQLQCQFFNDQGPFSCTINANAPAMFNGLYNRDWAINATFRVCGAGSCCTGTLVNRNTDDGHLGYYFISAHHCFEDAPLIGGESTDVFDFEFNYQSPDATTFNTPIPNRGFGSQSTLLSSNGYEYRHFSRVREVGKYAWGDFAMYEIIIPLPPHFDYTYAGWTPSRFWVAANSAPLNLPIPPTRIVSYHHSNADIKKISGYGQLLWSETPIATGCYAITQIIDIAFGWLWGNEVSTQVICNYVDNPFISIPFGQIIGTGDHGSSGASIFNEDNRSFGVCTITPNVCGSGINMYGKLYGNYSQQNIKNAFNPSNDIWTDIVGMGPRKIKCPESLNLNASDHAYYFAASHYHSNNSVVLSAINNITTTPGNRVRVLGAYSFPSNAGSTLPGFPAADYTLKAGNEIELNPDFETEMGVSFEAKIEPCTGTNRETSKSAQAFILEKIKSITLPQKKDLDVASIEKENQKALLKTDLIAYPNPFNEALEINFQVKKADTYSLFITNAQGVVIERLSENELFGQGKHQIEFASRNLPIGLYFLVLKSNIMTEMVKVVKL